MAACHTNSDHAPHSQSVLEIYNEVLGLSSSTGSTRDAVTELTSGFAEKPLLVKFAKASADARSVQSTRGAKAENLVRLKELGMPVPNFVVLDAAALRQIFQSDPKLNALQNDLATRIVSKFDILSIANRMEAYLQNVDLSERLQGFGEFIEQSEVFPPFAVRSLGTF